MIKKLLGKLLKPIILKEVRSMMKDFVQPILDLIKNLVQPQQGTKFLLSLASLGTIFYMHKSAIATPTSDIIIAVLLSVYYIADIIAKTRKSKNGNSIGKNNGN